MKLKALIAFLLVVTLLFGCTNQEQAWTLDDVNQIKIELIEKESRENGTNYSIRLKNDSDFVIKYNNVYLYYPIKSDNNNSQKENHYKVLATGNKLNIQPGEEVLLRAFMPFEGLGDKSSLAMNEPAYKFIGYWEKVDEPHLFSKAGSLK